MTSYDDAPHEVQEVIRRLRRKGVDASTAATVALMKLMTDDVLSLTRRAIKDVGPDAPLLNLMILWVRIGVRLQRDDPRLGALVEAGLMTILQGDQAAAASFENIYERVVSMVGSARDLFGEAPMEVS